MFLVKILLLSLSRKYISNKKILSSPFRPPSLYQSWLLSRIQLRLLTRGQVAILKDLEQVINRAKTSNFVWFFGDYYSWARNIKVTKNPFVTLLSHIFNSKYRSAPAPEQNSALPPSVQNYNPSNIKMSNRICNTVNNNGPFDFPYAQQRFAFSVPKIHCLKKRGL